MSTETKTNEKNLFQKLIEVKKAVAYIQKDASSGGGGFSYKYASGSNVLLKVNEILNKEGVILKTEVVKSTYMPIEIEVRRNNQPTKKTEYLYSLEMLMTWVNADNPEEKDENHWAGYGCNGEEKGFGSALTYAERYFMLKYFNIPTDDMDPDKIIKDQDDKNGQDKKNGTKPAGTPVNGNGVQNQNGKNNLAQGSKAWQEAANEYDKLFSDNMSVLTSKQQQTYMRKANWTLEQILMASDKLKGIIQKVEAEYGDALKSEM